MAYEPHVKKAAALKKFVGHPAYAELQQDMESFFANVGYFADSSDGGQAFHFKADSESDRSRTAFR
jgi:hypothetical protein